MKTTERITAARFGKIVEDATAGIAAILIVTCIAAVAAPLAHWLGWF